MIRTFSVAFGAFFVAALIGCSSPLPGAERRAAVSQTAALPAPVDIAAASALSLSAVGEPDWVEATPQGVWVANVDPGLVRYAPDGSVTASVETGLITTAMETGFESLWVSDAEGTSILRVDLADPTRQTRIALPVGKFIPPESSLAVTDAAVWALTTDGSMVKVDPVSDAAAVAFAAPDGASAVRGGFGSLWVTRSVDKAVDRVDPATGSVRETIPVGTSPRFLTVGGNAVWVMNQDQGTVSRIDPLDSKVAATIRVSNGPIEGGDIASSADSVWVRTTSELAVQIDTRNNSVVRVLGPPSGSGSIAIVVGAVWISAHDVHTVWRVPLR